MDEPPVTVDGRPRGRVRRAVLLAIGGAFMGAPLGVFLGGFLSYVAVCRGGDGSLAAGEGCGMSFFVFSAVGILVGAVVGAIVGAVVGARVRVPAPMPEVAGPRPSTAPTAL